MTLAPPLKDLEVTLKSESAKAVIEGKTAIPFQRFVMLILQRKVFSLFREWGKEPVILSSELLTSLASAPQDSVENRTRLILVTLGTGLLCGVFTLAIIEVILASSGTTLGIKELLLIVMGILALGILVTALSRVQRGRGGEKVTEAMEKVASLLSK